MKFNYYRWLSCSAHRVKNTTSKKNAFYYQSAKRRAHSRAEGWVCFHSLTFMAYLGAVFIPFHLLNTFNGISSAAYCTFSAAGTTINSNWRHNLRMRVLIFNWNANDLTIQFAPSPVFVQSSSLINLHSLKKGRLLNLLQPLVSGIHWPFLRLSEDIFQDASQATKHWTWQEIATLH